MIASDATTTIRTYCTLCGVGCPSAITIAGTRVLKLEADREHPEGGAVCGKGRAAPEIHDHAHRVNYPVRRTRPKLDDDPGWERITWDEALDVIATKMLAVRAQSGPEAVAFGRGTGSGTGLRPMEPWFQRLANAFGTPNYMTNTHLCNWARDGAAYYTLGVYPVPLPDVENSGCIVLWGSNPPATLLSLGTRTVAARQRGARLVVIDPRRVGLANRADVLLQVRPGTDGALALAFIHLLIEERSYDHAFVREWTNAPLLVREDTGRLLRIGDQFAAVDDGGALVAYDAPTGRYDAPVERLALRAETTVEGVRCHTVLELLAREAHAYEPERAARITGVSETAITDALRIMVEHRPTSFHTWNGIMQHTNATQGGRAIEIFFALLGDWDRRGGNVVPSRSRTRDIVSVKLSDQAAALRLGRDDRPLGPQAVPPGNIVAYDLYDAILDARPYAVRALVSFGGNTIMNTGDPVRGRAAFQKLEFFAQMEVFHTPTSAYADVLLPATTFLENDTLVITPEGVAQRRIPAVPPLHERRADFDLIFDLATRLGMGDAFSGGDVAAAYDEILSPAGLTWEGLRSAPHGVRVTPPPSYEKHLAAGFATPSRKVELWSERFATEGVPALPRYEEPAESPVRTPELARGYPLVMTNAKLPQYLHSQHRGVAAIRRTHPDPSIEIHPETAARYGITDHAWVMIETPRGQARARADVTDAIAPGIVCGFHGWWESCVPLDRPALDPYTARGANVNLLVHNDVRDPISGAIPHRSTLCRIRPLEEA
jgi:anaerobic selenocysteine-containing dehydrogenase